MIILELTHCAAFVTLSLCFTAQIRLIVYLIPELPTLNGFTLLKVHSVLVASKIAFASSSTAIS